MLWLHIQSNVRRIKANHVIIIVSIQLHIPKRIVPSSCSSRQSVLHQLKVRGVADRIHKGLSPTGVRAWPCSSSDTIKFGAAVPTPPGLPEENNGQVFFERAGFKPLLVNYLPADMFSVAAPDQARQHLFRGAGATKAAEAAAGAPVMEMDRGENLPGEP